MSSAPTCFFGYAWCENDKYAHLKFIKHQIESRTQGKVDVILDRESYKANEDFDDKLSIIRMSSFFNVFNRHSYSVNKLVEFLNLMISNLKLYFRIILCKEGEIIQTLRVSIFEHWENYAFIAFYQKGKNGFLIIFETTFYNLKLFKYPTSIVFFWIIMNSPEFS